MKKLKEILIAIVFVISCLALFISVGAIIMDKAIDLVSVSILIVIAILIYLTGRFLLKRKTTDKKPDKSVGTNILIEILAGILFLAGIGLLIILGSKTEVTITLTEEEILSRRVGAFLASAFPATVGGLIAYYEAKEKHRKYLFLRFSTVFFVLALIVSLI